SGVPVLRADPYGLDVESLLAGLRRLRLTRRDVGVGLVLGLGIAEVRPRPGLVGDDLALLVAVEAHRYGLTRVRGLDQDSRVRVVREPQVRIRPGDGRVASRRVARDVVRVRLL